ncbi:hypothetical protein BKA93DRAFT_403454 [Sparassis latifolia]
MEPRSRTARKTLVEKILAMDSSQFIRHPKTCLMHYQAAANPEYMQPLGSSRGRRQDRRWGHGVCEQDATSRQLYEGIATGQRDSRQRGDSFSRKAMKDITLSKGIMFPKGGHDLNADVFDAFRFSNMRAGEGSLFPFS